MFFKLLKTILANDSSIPKINLTFPSALPNCKEIASNGHNDLRIIVWCIDSTKPFSLKSFSEYAKEDIGNIKSVFKSLIEKGIIEELSQDKILTTIYSADELKTFLQAQNLKVSGNKEVLAKRLLEKVPFDAFKRKYKNKLYTVTEIGLRYFQSERDDYNQAVISAVNAIKQKNFTDAVKAFNLYDEKWGFLHADGKPHTIFANYEVPKYRLDYVFSYHMNELNNSENFKTDLRAYMVTILMRKSGSYNTDEFLLINNETIVCPNILKMYKYDRDDDIEKDYLEQIIDGMRLNIEKNPNAVLDYYISKIIYKSKH